MKISSSKLSTRLFILSLITLFVMILIFTFGIAVTATLDFEIKQAVNFLQKERIRAFLILFVIAGFVGASAMSYIIIKTQLKPYNMLKEGMNKLTKGDFEVRLDTSNINVSEFVSLIEEFNTLARELNSTELFKKDFINNFSHEFKTPIASIKGFAKILQNSELTKEEEQEYLNIIVSESTRLSRLSQNIMTLCKIENQGIITNEEWYVLSEQVRLAVLTLENEWSKKNLCFDLDIDDFEFYGNKDILNHVWINLLDNAIKFSPQNADISMKLHSKDGNVVFSITDYGSGMDEETIANIFTKFYQGDSSHSLKGNGIGLSIVKSVVGFYNGVIDVKSVQNKWTTFSITFPLQNTSEKPDISQIS